jgi:hypothetical protein
LNLRTQNILQEVSQTASPAASPSKQHSGKSRFEYQATSSSFGSNAQAHADAQTSNASYMSSSSFSSVSLSARSNTSTSSHPHPHKTEPHVTYITVTTPHGIPPPPTESARGKDSPLISEMGPYGGGNSNSNSNPSGSGSGSGCSSKAGAPRGSPLSPRGGGGGGVVGGIVSSLTAGFGGSVKSTDSNKSNWGSSAQVGNSKSVYSYSKSPTMNGGHNACNSNSPSMQDQNYDQQKSYAGKGKEQDKRSSCPASYVHSYPMATVTTEDSDMRFSCNTTNSHATSEDVSSDCVTDCITDCEPISYPIVNQPAIGSKSSTYSAMHGKHSGVINVFGAHHSYHSSSNSPLPDTSTASPCTSVPTTPRALASTPTIGGLQVWHAVLPRAHVHVHVAAVGVHSFE